MSKINLILFIYLINPRFILMLNNNSNEYLIETCCSLNKNDRISLSCSQNEKIHLNLIKIYYNSDQYCSSQSNCCKYQTKCSRRITKYSSLHCDEKNSCWIDRTCLKIYEPCASVYGLYGQYITINYSCLSTNEKYQLNNSTNYIDYQPVPFIVKLLTSEEEETTTIENSLNKKTFVTFNNLKSSPIFLISVIFIFISLMFISYWLADQIGKKVCRQKNLKRNVKTNTINTKILIQHSAEDKNKVESNLSLPIKYIYPSQTPLYRYYQQPYYDYDCDYCNRPKYRYNPYSFNSSKRYVHLQHHPTNGQIYSRTFNYYPN